MSAENKTPKTFEELNRKDKLDGKVTKISMAGAFIDIGIDVPGIIHISQIQEGSLNKIEDALEVGQEVEVWVKRLFPKKRRVELTMVEPLPLEWREIKDEMVIKGTIARLEKYGAFVDIGAERQGLIHISELAHGYIKTPEDAVKVGDEVDVKVLKVNRRKKQIKLSMKALMEEPKKIMERVNKEAARAAKAVSEDTTPVPTAMEIALREAMEKSQSSNAEAKEAGKKSSKDSAIQDDLLARTLKHKVNTSS